MNQTANEPVHTIKIPTVSSNPKQLAFQGTNPQGNTISVNQRFLEMDGKPWLPVMGEFHFSRYPEQEWRDELLKMKAGGITVIATYIFWIHIEEFEGVFNWEKNNNLRKFIQLCQDLGLFAYPRIGPWAHGECRNGGFPDWLLEKCASQVRQDAQPYLNYVSRFYQSIFQQVKGLLWKDGGPVIGIQIENELTDNPAHISTLKEMAQAIGFEVPLYTMTGWGPAQIPSSGIIPVFGGYPDAFWDRQVDHWADASKKHYFFTPIRDDNTIGADMCPRTGLEDLSFLTEYPYGTCETGGGMQIAYHRRPFISGKDVAALAQVKIGNGSNLQGYYMYHGGSNPADRSTPMQESQTTGYPNDLPVIDYDFQAPLGEYGQVRESYHRLRLLHIFLKHFGEKLATYPPHFPPDHPQAVDDQMTLRWAVRSNGMQGFIFINNYQRVDQLPAHAGVQFQIELENETITIPRQPVTIPQNAYTIWPFNLELSGAILRYATAQPICQLSVNGSPTYVFCKSEGVETEFVFAPGALTRQDENQPSGEDIIIRINPDDEHLVTLQTSFAKTFSILLLSQESALQLFPVAFKGQEFIALAHGSLFVDDTRIRNILPAAEAVSIAFYPAPPDPFQGNGHLFKIHQEDLFTRFSFSLPHQKPKVHAELVRAAEPARIVPIGPFGVAQEPEEVDFEKALVYRLTLSEAQVQTPLKNWLLRIEYVGDAARMYIGKQLVEDDFYCGRAWEIGLSRFRETIFQQEVELRILPLRKDAPIYLDESARLDFSTQDAIARLLSITIIPMIEIDMQSI
jgi:beta-galactosidase